MKLLRSRLQLFVACSAVSALALAGHGGFTANALAQAPTVEPSLLDAYRWRSIGPDRGGRSIAVSGVKAARWRRISVPSGAGCGRQPTPATTGCR